MLKSGKYSHLISSLHHPYCIDLELSWKYFLNKMEMSYNEKDTVNDVLNILKVELSNDSEHQEQLAVLVASGKAKKMIGVSLT